jgi:hypothetical protein
MPKAKAKTESVAFNSSSVGAFLQRFGWVACPSASGSVLWRRPDLMAIISTGEAWDRTMKALIESREWKLRILSKSDSPL